MRGTVVKAIAALMMPLALGSCFITPGAFVSTLDLRRDGTFAFGYKGEVVFLSPDELMKMGDKPEDKVWKDDKAVCYKDGDDAAAGAIDKAADAMAEAANATGNMTGGNSSDTEIKAGDDETTRPCTPKEIAEQKKDWEDDKKKRDEKNKKEAAQFGAIFGFTPGDDAANRKLAATMMRYEGWKSVVYKGAGVFEVDYAASGRLDYDLVFPLFPQSDMIFPFVTVRRQADGAVRVGAPALIGGGLKALAARMKAVGAAIGDREIPPSTRTKGTFTITTDGEILTNNTENGATRVATGRQLMWEIGPESEKVPEALVRLR